VGIPAVRREPLLLLTLLGAVLALAGPAARSTASERELALVATVNEVRAEHGLRPVVLVSSLADEARRAGAGFVIGRFQGETGVRIAVVRLSA